MDPIVTPLLLSALVAGGLFAVRAKTPDAPPNKPLPPPTPDPNGGGGGLGPINPQTVTDLLRQFGTVAASAAVNPASVNARQIGLLAAALRANGRTDEASQLENQIGPLVCQAQGQLGMCWTVPVAGGAAPGPAPGGAAPPAALPANGVLPAPGPVFPPLLPADSAQAIYRQTIAAAQANLLTVPADRLERFARGAAAGKLPAEAAELSRLARLRAAAGLTAAQQAALSDFAAAKARPLLTNDPNALDALVERLGSNGFPKEAQEAAALAAQLRAGLAAGAKNPYPSTLPPELVAQIRNALTSPTVTAVQVDTLVATLQMTYPNGALTQVTQLQRRANELREQGR